MARSDLLLSLVKASSAGDTRLVRSTVEAMVAEERAKQHTVLAEQLMRALNGSGKSPGWQPSGRHLELVAEIQPRRQLEDMVLPEETRLACDQLIEEQMRASLLRAHGLEPRHRVLLVGPPGNGKTSLAEALAERLALPFFVVRYETIIGSYLGETAGRLKRLFDYVRSTPCVVFFDELDALGKERGDLHETGEIKRVVVSLLLQLDDLPSYTVVVAATNHPELLDRAVWRRFQLRLSLPAPRNGELADFIFQRLKPFEVKKATCTKVSKKLGVASFAEAEQFTLDVARRHVLGSAGRPVGDIIDEQLRLWSARVSSHVGGDPDDESSAAPPAETDESARQ